ncbi:MAG: transposase [Candidatus Nitrosopolaris sp.]
MVNWASYNESLVRRGELILDFDIIDGWYDELERMNEGKKGAAYDYPDSFVQLLGYVKAYFHLPYRQTEGVVRAHAAEKVYLGDGRRFFSSARNCTASNR